MEVVVSHPLCCCYTTVTAKTFRSSYKQPFLIPQFPSSSSSSSPHFPFLSFRTTTLSHRPSPFPLSPGTLSILFIYLFIYFNSHVYYFIYFIIFCFCVNGFHSSSVCDAWESIEQRWGRGGGYSHKWFRTSR